MTEPKDLINKYPPRFKVKLVIQGIPFTVMTNSAELAEMLRSYLNLWVKDKIENTGHILYAIVGDCDIEYDRLVDVQRKSQKSVKEAAYDTDEGRVILKKRTGVIVFQKQDERYIVGDLVLNINQVINVIDEVYISDYLRQGYVLLHSSAVVDMNGNGVVFASESGSGKSTMAVALLEHGFHYLSNDRTLIKAEEESVVMLGVPKKPRLNPARSWLYPA
jgi:HprK-related kinase B